MSKTTHRDQSRKTIIAFLDHYANIDPYKMMFSKKFEIAIASHLWDEVIKSIDIKKPDVLVMDLRIDGSYETGYEVIRRAKKASPSTKIVILTAAEEHAIYLVRAFVAGADSYISRRVTGVSLVDAVNVVLQGAVIITPKTPLQKIMETGSQIIEQTDPEKKNKLTPAEKELLQLVAQGLTTHQIAEQLNKAEPTLKSQMRSINQKLNTKNRWQAVFVAGNAGLININIEDD